MTANLRKTADLADEIANGNLTVNHVALSERDKLGLALIAMIDRLRDVVSDASTASENVSAGSQQLAASSEQVSQGATEQAAAAEQASASMEEMAANIKQNADNAAQTEKIARQSAKDAESSGVWSTARSRPCARLPTRSASSRKSPARPTCSLSMPQWKRLARASTAGALPWSRAKCASWPSAARRPPRKSVRSRPTR
jgi:hypothetical protein